jgi:hypothetical protein
MNEEIVKNWVTVPKKNVDEALSWAKQFNDYITNDYAVVGGRIEHYQQGNDYDNFDFFFEPKSKVLKEFVELFGVKE